MKVITLLAFLSLSACCTNTPVDRMVFPTPPAKLMIPTQPLKQILVPTVAAPEKKNG